MTDISKKQSLTSLWFFTFSLINRSLGTMFKALLIFCLPLIVAPILFYLLPLFIRSNSFGTGVIFLLLLVPLICAVLSGLAPFVLSRLYGAQIEQRIESISQAVIASLLPAIYTTILGIFFSVCILLLLLLMGILFPTRLALLLFSAICLIFSVRLIYVFPALILRDKGPFEAVSYSWDLTSGAEGYLHALGILISLMIFSLIPTLFLAACYGIIPLWMPQLNIALLPWALLIALGVILLFIFLGFSLCALVYPLVVFVNEDNQIYAKEWARAPQMHIINRHAPSTVQTAPGEPEVKFNGEETIRLNTEEIQAITVQSTPVAAQGKEKNLQDHLDQVFKKVPGNVPQPVKEDRMPTILFDDKMAKQLKESHEMLNKKDDKNTKKRGEDGPQSVKMSQ